MTTTNQQGMIAKKQSSTVAKKQPQTIKDYISVMSGEIAKALPSVMTPERFTRIALSAVSNNAKLASCTPQSFLAAMMNAAQLGLEPNTPLGQAYLIPYGGACQFQIGYKGLIDLAYRSGEVKMIDAQVVYENDEFEYELGMDPVLKHKPARTNRGKPIYYYATFKLVNGGQGFQVMSYEDVLDHAKKYSKSYSSGPWKTNFDEMAKKTMLRQLLSKHALLSTEAIEKAVTSDNAVIDENLNPHFEDENIIDGVATEKETPQAIEANTAPTMQDIIKEEKQAEKVPVDDFDPMSM